MILEICRIPNPFLKTLAHLVEPHLEGLQGFVDDMVETMYHQPRCVGIAATQVGRPWRLIVMDATRVDKPGSQHGRLILLNPFITHRRGQQLIREGCLSVPDFTGNVLRAHSVRVHAKDRGGEFVEINAEGFEAVVLQHELDHLDGKLFLDRVASSDIFRRKQYC